MKPVQKEEICWTCHRALLEWEEDGRQCSTCLHVCPMPEDNEKKVQGRMFDG